MSSFMQAGHAFNQTRQVHLATSLRAANTHWTRLVGLMGKNEGEFPSGHGLWITPCRGVHTMGMRIPIDVIYLDADNAVVHLEQGLKPWRMAPVMWKATSVLELPQDSIASTGTQLGDKIEIVLNHSPKAATA